MAGALSGVFLLTCLVAFELPTSAADLAPGLSEAQQYELSVSKGLVKFANAEYSEAEALFRQALQAKPGDPEATEHLAQTLIRLKRYAEAEDLFSRITTQHPSGAAYLGLAIAQYYQEKYRDALTSLERAERLAPDHPLVHFYRGLTLNKLGQFQQAARAFDRAMVLSPDLAPEGHYQRGLARYGLGMVDEAQAEFRAIVSTQPESELARSARRFLGQIGAPVAQGPKRWNLDLALSGQYDSNVVLLPLGVQPPGGPTGISRKDDYRAVVYGRGEYRPIQTDLWTVGVAYGFYRSFHRRLHGFDVEDHTPAVSVLRRFGFAELSMQYVYDYVTVGHAPFLISHAVHPVLTLRESDRLFTQIHAQYQNKDFQDARFTSNSARDGKNWLAGFTQYVLYADRSGHVRFGYFFDTDRTGGGSPSIAIPGQTTNADWAYVGHRLSTGVGLPPIRTVKLDFGFDFYRQQYDNPNSFSATGTTVRRDNIYILTATATKELTSWLSLSFEYNYTRDQNNISVFDYSRSVYSLMLAGHF
jgi:tetratricopeptide (TPR) repeat protein